MSLGAEIFRFIFDLTKIISMIIAVTVILFVVTAVITGIYGESVFACPDRRLRFTDEEAISFTKKYMENQGFDERITTSMDYKKSYAPNIKGYGWEVSRKPRSNYFLAEKIELSFTGREDEAHVGCLILSCGVMLGCDKHYVFTLE